MADYSRAQITIGGRIDAGLVLSLCEAITREQIFVASKSEPFAPTSEVDLLAARQRVDGHWVLRMEDDQARYGEFEALEAFLIENRIAFHRRTWPHHDYSASQVYYRPETGREVWPIDNEGTLLMPAAPVWEAYEAICRGGASSRHIIEELRQYIPAPDTLPELHFIARVYQEQV